MEEFPIRSAAYRSANLSERGSGSGLKRVFSRFSRYEFHMQLQQPRGPTLRENARSPRILNASCNRIYWGNPNRVDASSAVLLAALHALRTIFTLCTLYALSMHPPCTRLGVVRESNAARPNAVRASGEVYRRISAGSHRAAHNQLNCVELEILKFRIKF